MTTGILTSEVEKCPQQCPLIFQSDIISNSKMTYSDSIKMNTKMMVNQTYYYLRYLVFKKNITAILVFSNYCEKYQWVRHRKSNQSNPNIPTRVNLQRFDPSMHHHLLIIQNINQIFQINLSYQIIIKIFKILLHLHRNSLKCWIINGFEILFGILFTPSVFCQRSRKQCFYNCNLNSTCKNSCLHLKSRN